MDTVRQSLPEMGPVLSSKPTRPAIPRDTKHSLCVYYPATTRRRYPPALGRPVWLSVREAATALGVSTATVYKLCATGRLKHIRVGNPIRIDAAALQSTSWGSALPCVCEG